MEEFEYKYRSTPPESKKYVKRLTEFINSLMSNGKIIEAKHHFKNLYKAKPNHIKTIRIGYLLSIATFDNEGVIKFDKLLFDSRPRDIEILWLQLKYYLSTSDQKGCEHCCKKLLSQKIKSEQLTTAIDACLNLESYEIAADLVNYFKRERIKLNINGEISLKKILIKRLINRIAENKIG